MKKLIWLSILTVTFLCDRSYGAIKCAPDKFPVLDPNPPELFRFYESLDLAADFCMSLLGQTGRRSTKLLTKCTNAHRDYFRNVDVNETVIKKYADFCAKYRTSGSCYYPANSAMLLRNLSNYCWTMDEIASSNKDIFNKDVNLTPEDWNDLYGIANMNPSLCFDQISSDYVSEDSQDLIGPEGPSANIKFKNLKLLKQYKKSLTNGKSYCNCVEVLGLQKLFDTFLANNFMVYNRPDKKEFIEDICTKSQKKHFWKKEQLEAISEFVADRNNVSKYHIRIEKITAFILEAYSLTNKRWYSNEPNFHNSKWPITYLFEKALVDNYIEFGKPLDVKIFVTNDKETTKNLLFDETKLKVMAKAIFHGFSTQLFDEFYDIVGKINIPSFGYPLKKWDCNELIMNTFFDYNRSENLPDIKYDNYQYRKGNVQYALQHLKLFIQLENAPTEGSRNVIMHCGILSSDIKKVLELYYTYWSDVNVSHLTTLLTSALNNKQNLWSFAKCLKFSSSIEKIILERQLLKYPKHPSEPTTVDIENFETTMLMQLREKFFGTKEFYGLCGNENPQFKTVVNVLEIVYNMDLPDVFLIPDDIEFYNSMLYKH